MTLATQSPHNELMFRHLFLPHESNNHRAKLLHPSTILTLIVVFLSFQLLVTKLSLSYPQILGYAAAQISPEEVIKLTNEQRVANGLDIVKLDPELTAAAVQKAADMFARNYWAHVSPVGTQPWYFITEAGYSYRYAGENLARDFSDPQSVVQAWMSSPSHRENILNTKYQDIGLAVVDGKLEGRETTLVVQMFGTKLSAQPTLGKSSSTEISVMAAGSSVNPSVKAFSTTPFDVSRTVSIVLLAVFVLVLVIDLVHLKRQKIVRWTSSSLAHLLFMTFLLLTALFISKGHII